LSLLKPDEEARRCSAAYLARSKANRRVDLLIAESDHNRSHCVERSITRAQPSRKFVMAELASALVASNEEQSFSVCTDNAATT
jgi:hypothetical protein